MKSFYSEITNSNNRMYIQRSFVCLLLSVSTVFGHNLNHEMSSASSSSFLFNQKDAGTGQLDDAKMTHLTDSIQGLFDGVAVLPKVPAKAATPTEKKAAVEVVKASKQVAVKTSSAPQKHAVTQTVSKP